MPGSEVSHCPQCVLFVPAAMSVYQYVLRDRVRNGMGTDDELLDRDIEQIDAEIQLMLLDVLSRDHTLSTRASPASLSDKMHSA